MVPAKTIQAEVLRCRTNCGCERIAVDRQQLAFQRNEKRPDALRLVARPASKSILTFRLSDSICGPIASCIRSRSSVITGFGVVFGHYRLGILPAANALIRALGCDWTTETLTNDSVSVTSL